LPVLMEIPFDRRVAETYARGQMLIEALPEYKERFRQLYRDVIGVVADHRTVTGSDLHFDKTCQSVGLTP